MGWGGVDGLQLAILAQPALVKQRQVGVAAIAPVAAEGCKACEDVVKDFRWWDDIREGCHTIVVCFGDVGRSHEGVPHKFADGSPC